MLQSRMIYKIYISFNDYSFELSKINKQWEISLILKLRTSIHELPLPLLMIWTLDFSNLPLLVYFTYTDVMTYITVRN